MEMKSIYFSLRLDERSKCTLIFLIVSDMKWLAALLVLLLYIGNENSPSPHRIEIPRARGSHHQRSACLILIFMWNNSLLLLQIKCSVNSKNRHQITSANREISALIRRSYLNQQRNREIEAERSLVEVH